MERKLRERFRTEKAENPDESCGRNKCVRFAADLEQTLSPAMDAALKLKAAKFDRPSSVYNFPFHVEGRIFWTPGELLACHSPVLRAMIYGEFKDASEKRAELPGPNAADFLEFILCIVPTPLLKPITENNVERMLQLSRDWEVETLQERCEQFYTRSLSTKKHSHQRVLDLLVMAAKFNLKNLLKAAIARSLYIPLSEIQKRHHDIPAEVVAAIYLAMIKKFKLKRPHHSFSDKGSECEACGEAESVKECEVCKESVCTSCNSDDEDCLGSTPCLVHQPAPICDLCNADWYKDLDDILEKI